MKRLLLAIAVLAMAGAGMLEWNGEPAAASSDCTFTIAGATMTLDADCTTDETIFIPDGFTLDGSRRTITAVDPMLGGFNGAVVRNAGATAHVKNLSVTTASLANICKPRAPVDLRLRASSSTAPVVASSRIPLPTSIKALAAARKGTQ